MAEAPRYAPREHAPEIEVDAPGDPVNEQVVLCAAFADEDVLDRVVALGADSFDVEEHRVIVAGLQEMRRKKLSFDPGTLQRFAPELDPRIIEQLLAARAGSPNIDHHLETLEWDRQRRALCRGPLAALLEAVQDPRTEPARLRELKRQVGEADVGGGAGRLIRNPDEVVRQAVADIRKRIGGRVYRFGVPALDADEKGAPRFFPGPAPGRLIVITARSGNGKSTLAEHVVLGLARQRRRVLFGAWEEDDYGTIEALATFDLGWDRMRMIRGLSSEAEGPLSDEEVERHERKMSGISRYVQFVDNPAVETARTRAKVTNLDHVEMLVAEVEASGADVVVLDLFDRCLVSRKPEDEHRALTYLLDATKRLRVTTFVVHQQLNKGETIRADNRPSVENLKGSSSYFEVAHLILAPHVPARWKDVPDTTVEIFVLKDRDGPSPYGIEVDWDPATGRFADSRTIPYEQSSRFGRAREKAIEKAPRGKVGRSLGEGHS